MGVGRWGWAPGDPGAGDGVADHAGTDARGSWPGDLDSDPRPVCTGELTDLRAKLIEMSSSWTEHGDLILGYPFGIWSYYGRRYGKASALERARAERRARIWQGSSPSLVILDEVTAWGGPPPAPPEPTEILQGYSRQGTNEMGATCWDLARSVTGPVWAYPCGCGLASGSWPSLPYAPTRPSWPWSDE